MKIKKLNILILTLLIIFLISQINIVISDTNKNLVNIKSDTNTWNFNSSWNSFMSKNYSTGNATSGSYIDSTMGLIYGHPKMNETGDGQAQGWMNHSIEWDCPVDNESGVINISYEYFAFAFLKVNSSGNASAKLCMTFFIDDIQHEEIIFNNSIDEINETVNFSLNSTINWSKNLTLYNKTYTIGVNASYLIEYTGNDTQSIALLYILVPDKSTEESDEDTEYRAVLIGVDCMWRYLDTIHISFHENAEEMKKILLFSDDYWQENHIKILSQEKATFLNIVSALQWLNKEDDGDDISLVYYAAHGGNFKDYTLFEGTMFERYMGDWDIPPKDEDDGYDEFLSVYRGFPIWDDLFNFLLDRLDSKSTVVIIDACYSGGMSDEDSSTWITEFSGEISNGDKVVVTCSGEHEEGHIYKGESLSDCIFSGLQGTGDDSSWGNCDGVVSIEEAFRYAEPEYLDRIHPYVCDPQIYDSDTNNEIILTNVEKPPYMASHHGNIVNFGELGTTYIFNALSADPKNDNIRYGWNWGKDMSYQASYAPEHFWGWGGYSVEDWSDYYNSGHYCSVSHMWNEPGIYAVRVKAQDEHGVEEIDNYAYYRLWSNWPRYFVINAEDEIVDQYQLTTDRFYTITYGLAQSFRPDSNYLSKIKIKLGLHYKYDYFVNDPDFIEYPLKVSIRDDLYGQDLTSASIKSSTQLKESKGVVDWIEVDFTNINVIPNKKYYIVLENRPLPFDENDGWFQVYKWLARKSPLAYKRGETYALDNEGVWNFWSGSIGDYCFLTYALLPIDTGGPYYTLLDEQPVQFNGSAFGNPPFNWFWDFGDGNTSEEQNPTHTYELTGNYTVNLTVTDIEDVTTNDTTWVNIRDYNNPPYIPVKPSGPTICKKDKNYSYSSYANDPDGDPMYYMLDWGDKTTSEWLGPVNSGQTHIATHNWSQWGFYKIKVKVKDVYGNESDWSEGKWVYVRLFSGFGISPSSYSQSSQTVYFNDNSKSYYQIVNWTWDFGDGNFSYSQNTSHTYATDGIYNVTLTITDNMSACNVSSQQICVDSVQPEITSVTGPSTSLAGFNSDIDINVDTYDEFSGVETVEINVTYPDESYHIFTLNNNTNSSIYDLVFDDTWLVGQFNYTVLVFDKSNNSNSSSGHNFNISMQATMSVCTIKDEYGPNEMINLTDPPGEPPLIGYELLDNGDVLHIWNKHNSYYFDTESGIQLTNHYDEYWSHNVLMLGYYNNDQWNLVYRTDELSGFNKNLNSDNETYVNATLWKDLSYGGYDFRLALRYHLGLDDADLTVIPYIKNLGENEIPYNLGFGWEIKDIQIADVENDNYLQIYNGTGWEQIPLSQTLDKSYTDMDHNTTIRLICTNPSTYHLSRELYLSWNENLTYKVTCKSRTGQNNAPVTLFIKIGTLDVDQEKYTELHWLDSDDWLGITGSNRDSECGYDHNTVSFEKALNGTSYWAHDQWETHWGIVDLGQSYTVKKVRGRSDFFDDPIDVNIYVSENKTNWGTAVATGINTWQDTFSWVEVDTVDKDGRYIKIEIIDTESMIHTLSFGNDMMPFKIFDVYGGINQAPMISNPFPSDGSTGVSSSPMLKISVSDPDYDNMNITWLSNSSGSWVPFGTNYSVGNGLYTQSLVNASVNGQWWYWKVNVSDGSNFNESSVYKFYTGCQSKIKNTGSTNISGYLLIQIQYYNTSSSTWVVANDTINETNPRTINSSEQFGLDTVFNGLVNTSSLSEYGSGSYRIYAVFRDPEGNALICDNNSELIATYEFTVTLD
ncbi:hypothetical protein AYK24_07575 [Thermoplasmatales archaeon SG8-52-4]|nr:MAG: hypothetical protein AYK24_07575 [Thermoplasmatales archaeon SG8-52-4]